MRITIQANITKQLGRISGEQEINMTRLVNELLQQQIDIINGDAKEAQDARPAKEETEDDKDLQNN